VQEVGPFVALTFGISWGMWAICLALGGDLTDPVVLLLWGIGGLGPTLAALVLRLAGRRGARQAHARAVGRWAPAAILIGITPLTLARSSRAARTPASSPPGAAWSRSSCCSWSWCPAEEFGWRGHAQPRLRRALPPVRAALTVGVIWAVWHAPLFLTGSGGQQSIPLPSVAAAIYFASLVPMSVGYWFVSERLRGGVPAALLLHLSTNIVLALVTISSVTLASVVLAVATLGAVLIARFSRVSTPTPGEGFHARPLANGGSRRTELVARSRAEWEAHAAEHDRRETTARLRAAIFPRS
jgi:membrane protease YdiL (CAAX protease family)